VSTRHHVAVIGGGLAGITAAIALSEAGARVTLLEARPRLGGATCSFRRDGLVVDNGQHVFLRCCTAYRGLLARLGMTGAVTLQDRFDVTVLRPGGRARLRRGPLPGPLSMAGALAGYGFLPPAGRLRAVTAALGMALLDPGRPELDSRRLGDWLAGHGQDERARRVLWDLFTVSSLNVAGDEANLALAATVVKTALLSSSGAADIGVPAIPLGDLHGAAAAAQLTRLGASVRLCAKVAAVRPAAGGGYRVHLAGRAGTDRAAGQVLGADAVVLAVPAQAAAWLIPPAAVPLGAGDGMHNDRDEGNWAAGTDQIAAGADSAVAGGEGPGTGAGEAAGEGATAGPGGQPGAAAPAPGPWRDLGVSPIVNVHVIYDRRITRLPFAAAVGSPVQWVFDRTRPSGLRSGQYLAVSVSAADDYVNVPAAALREEFLPALESLFPAARDARVADFFVTRERRATLRQVPGCGRLRPGAATALPGLVLAGAWTDTGWPDTMEGAVRSGLNAARALRRGLAAPGALAGRQAVTTGPGQPPRRGGQRRRAGRRAGTAQRGAGALA
jgi:monoamine oxidase